MIAKQASGQMVALSAHLADRWRKRHKEKHINVHVCADELESALPKWTRITESPDTWPEFGATIMYQTKGFPHSLCMVFGKPVGVGRMTYWRPLCALDYPPEEKK